jgi:hypothetical protein
MASVLLRFFIVVSLLFSSSVFGADCEEYRWANPLGVWVKTAEAACQQQLTAFLGYWAGSNAPSGTLDCPGRLITRSNGSTYVVSIEQRTVVCSPDTKCTDQMGQNASGSNCKNGKCSYSYKAEDVSKGFTVSPYGRYCTGGCVAKGDIEYCGQVASSSLLGADRGSCTVSGAYMTGDSCDLLDAQEVTYSQSTAVDGTKSAVTSKSEPPPKGKCPGTVNGVDVLVDCGATIEKATSTVNKTTVNGSGTSTVSEITSTTTTCVNGKCTTTTSVGTGVTGTGTGSTTGSTTTTVTGGDQSDACAKNPSLSVCKSSSFSGSCSGGFTCDGDAATCAVAKATNESKCLITVADDIKNKGLAIMDGSISGTPDPKTEEGGLRKVDVGKLENIVNPYGDTCPADVPINVSGRAFMIPLSDHCDNLRRLGIVLHAMTLLASVVFVLRGVS